MRSVLTLFAVCCALTAALPAQAAPGKKASEAAPYHIMMLLYRGCEEACQGFQDYFRRQHVSVRFTLRDAAQDATRIPGFITEAKRLRPDLLVTWGTTVTLATVGRWDKVDPARHVTDLPVMFMIVSQPVELGVVPTLATSKRNVTGTLYLLPVEEQIRAARTYFEFHRIGFLYNPAEPNSKASRDELQALAPRFGYTVVAESLDLDAAGKPVAGSLPQRIDTLAKADVDLIYMSPDTFLNTHRQIVTSTAVAHGIPVFAAAEAPVVRGDALFGVVNRYDQVGRFSARQALRILRDGTPAANIPVELPRRFSYLINLRIAQRLGRYPPLPLLDVAEIINSCLEGSKCD
jgi:putative ABC transport system substrate-binding protein